MTSKQFKRVATVVFYGAGAVIAGLVLISWNASDIPPAAAPLSAAVESMSAAEHEGAVPLPVNDREPQNFAQPTADAEH